MLVLLVILLQIVGHLNGALALIDHPDDVVALVTIFNSTSGPNWSNNSGWLEWIARPQSLSFCSVFGVTNCSTVGPHRRVMSLNLASNNLCGMNSSSNQLVAPMFEFQSNKILSPVN
jgi:hypothetical protein